MKKVMGLGLGLVLALGFAGSVFADSPDLAAARTLLQKNRQATIATNLGLTQTEGRAFWPLYREYRTEMARVGDRLVKLVTEFDTKFDTLSDADASRMLDDYLSIQSSELAVRKRYVKSFRKALPPKKVARFYQIENKLDATLRYELSGLIPLTK